MNDSQTEQFSELSEELNQLTEFLDELVNENNSKQIETEQNIEHARNQLQILSVQIQEINAALKTKEDENLLLLSELQKASSFKNQITASAPLLAITDIPERLTEAESLIKDNKDLQEEIKILQQELNKREKHLHDLYDSHQRAEDVIIHENNLLKTDNESLNAEIKNMTQSYNKVKKDFLKQIETMRQMQLKLTAREHLVEENEKLIKENKMLSSKLKLENEKSKSINEVFKSYSNTLNSMKEKLMEQDSCVEINTQLKEEKYTLINNIKSNMLLLKKSEKEIKQKEQLLESALNKIALQDKKIETLEANLKQEQTKVVEITKHFEINIAEVQKEITTHNQITQDAAYKLDLFTKAYQEKLDELKGHEQYLTYTNINYKVDVEYLKGVIENQKKFITNLQNEYIESRLPQITTSDAEVTADIKVATTDASVLATNEFNDVKITTQDVGVSTTDEITDVKIITTRDVGVLAIDDTISNKEKAFLIEEVLDKVLRQLDTYKERNQNPCDSIDVIRKDENQDPYLTKILEQIDQKISSLLTEVKDFYESSIFDLHKKYRSEAERQLSFSETSLAKLKFCYEKNLKFMKRAHDEKVIRLLAAHEEEIKHMSIYQQQVHSIKEKLMKGKMSRRN